MRSSSSYSALTTVFLVSLDVSYLTKKRDSIAKHSSCTSDFAPMQVHFNMPKMMEHISGQLYRRVDHGISRPATTKPIEMIFDRPSAIDTVANAAFCHTGPASSLPMASEKAKEAEPPAVSSCGLHDDQGPAASPDGDLPVESLWPSSAAHFLVPAPLTVSMRQADPARWPAACHTPLIDLAAGTAASTTRTAVTTTALGPARLAASASRGAVDSDAAFEDAVRRHHGRRVEWAGATEAPAATTDDAVAAEGRTDPSSALNVRVAQRSLCPQISTSSAEPSAGIAAQEPERGPGGAWPAGGTCFVCQDAAADAVLIECGHGGMCSGDAMGRYSCPQRGLKGCGERRNHSELVRRVGEGDKAHSVTRFAEGFAVHDSEHPPVHADTPLPAPNTRDALDD